MSDFDIYSKLKNKWDSGEYSLPIGNRGLVQISPHLNNSDHIPLKEFIRAMYTNMIRDQKDQSLFLCGESGSGKSYSRSIIAKELCSLGHRSKERLKINVSGFMIEKVLSAFGSASMDPSIHASRFLLYQEFQFERAGNLTGVKTLDYGLEKDRICNVPSGESNFDIFYMLLVGANREEKSLYHLHDHTHYHYLNTGISHSYISDDFNNLRSFMKSSGIGAKLQAQIFKLLSCILHLGNITFLEENDHSSCTVKNRDILEIISELLGVSVSNLEFCLTYQTKIVQNEICTVFLNSKEAGFQRDEMAKSLYSLLFSWIINHLNDKFCQETCDTFISVLDIPGLRNSKKNSNTFNQLLFNYANEKVRTYTNINTWKSFQVHAFEEGIISDEGSSTDNSIVELIASSSTGILSVFDFETARSLKLGESDLVAGSRVATRLTERYSKTPNFKSSKTIKKKNVAESSSFTISHYTDINIEYDLAGFVKSNCDLLSPDLVALFRGNDEISPSTNKFARALFSDEIVSTKVFDRRQDVVTSAQLTRNPSRRPSSKKKSEAELKPETENQSSQDTKNIVDKDNFLAVEKNSAPIKESKMKDSEKKKKSKHSESEGDFSNDAPTFGSSFVKSMDELFNALEDCNTWFLICILNHSKNPKNLETTQVKKQLIFHGISSLNRYQASSPYSHSYLFSEFIDKFKSFFRIGANPALAVLDQREVCQDCIHEFEWKSTEAVLGNTEIFLSHLIWNKLHERMERVTKKTMGNYKSFSDYKGENLDEFADESDYCSDYPEDLRRNPDIENGLQQDDEDEKKAKKTTPARRKWVCLTWTLTWWIPTIFLSCCCGMKRNDIQMAFREKIALNIIIYFFCGVLLFYIGIFGRIICPKEAVVSSFELASKNDINDLWVSAYGRAYHVDALVTNHVNSYGLQQYMFSQFAGQDVSNLFYKANLFSFYCPGLPSPQADWDNIISRPISNSQNYAHVAIDPNTGRQKLYLEYMNQFAKYRIVWPMDYIKQIASSQKRLIVLYDNVYDVSAYFNSGNPFFGANVAQLFANFYGQDATAQWQKIVKIDPNAAAYLNCMNNLFYIGRVDHRRDFACQFSNYILLASSILLVTVIGFKFLAALQFGTRKDPESHDKFVIQLVTCYTEGPESLIKTLQSLAVTKYDDKRKLLFIIADGMIIGSGNDRPTPHIILDILGIDIEDDDTASYSFQSLGDGDKQHNMGKVYSGLYHAEGHSVPFIMISKMGKSSERFRPGNRGKRDSQMILMRFLSRVHFNSPMSPMELEIFHHMKNIIGVNPAFYEYVLMVDADTEVYPDSLNRLVSTMIHDSKIIGLCGETLISNEKDSWITMIQVYEYFISHHLAKAFESLFGSVTCLPGCFCMYRIRSPTKNVPLLICAGIIKDYSENKVDTLHLKNLLHLGEDRYLTTLMMKHFPYMKLSFTADAKCKTNAPDTWPILLSQRRRWINSTVHNLLELVFLPQLCGFCCFSMRFVVFLDLFSTIVQPVGILYIGYLVYSLLTSEEAFPVISIILLASIYGFQVIIFILKRQWAQIAWMFIYLLAMPAFSFYLPVYAFWHFDDFSWGTTRKVHGEGKSKSVAEMKEFDPSSIALRKWEANSQEKKSIPYKQSSRDSLDSRRNDFPNVPLDFDSCDDTISMKSSVTNTRRDINQPILLQSIRGGGGSQTSASLYKEYMDAGAPSMHKEYIPNTISVRSKGSSGKDRSMMSNISFGYPTDEQILIQIRILISNSDLMSITKKQVREELSKIFGMDMTVKKSTINYLLEQVLKGAI